MWYYNLLSNYQILGVIFILGFIKSAFGEVEEINDNQRYKIEGKVVVPLTTDQDWMSHTRILIDGGEYLGFLKNDGSFIVNNLPSGSYVVEVANPNYAFEPTRVDINSKGKIRARRVNNVQPSAVYTVTYPLKFKARGMASYFQQREQWRITDFLMNPMVLMMVLPFLMIMVLPKMMNAADPETQREMQSQMNMLNPKQNMPEISELFTSWLGVGKPEKKATKSKATKRR